MDLIQELAARQQIADVHHRYCRGLDRMDREMVLSVWHPGGTADYGQYFTGTAEDFIDWVWVYHATLWRHMHQVHNVFVTFPADDRAVSEAYYTVMLRERPAGGRVVDLIFRNRYLDRLSRRDGRWAIDERRCLVEMGTRHEHEEQPDLDGSTFPSRRDPQDASFELFGDQAS